MLEKELKIFGKEVIKNAKKNLDKNKIQDSNLADSLRFEVKDDTLTFFMNEYGEYVDAGVKGVGGEKADGSKWETKKGN